MSESPWPKMSLENIAEFVRRGTAPTYVHNSRVHAIGQRCVTKEGFNSDAARPHDENVMQRTLVVREGDVLLNSTGTGTIGRCCLYPGSWNHIVDGHITVIRCRPNHADGRWVAELLRSPVGQNYLETQCFSGSTNQVELSRSKLAASRWPMPSVAEQRRIAEILDTIDNAIQATQRLISKRREMHNGFTESLLWDVAHGASGVRCGEAFEIQSGVTLNPDRVPKDNSIGIGYLRVANVQRNELRLDDVSRLEVSETERLTRGLEIGDLLVVEGHANPDEIGRCAAVTSEAQGLVFQNHLFRLRSRSIDPIFGLEILNSTYVRRYWRSRCATSSGLFTINSRQLSDVPIPDVSVGEQKLFVDAVTSSKSLLEDGQVRLAKLRELRAGVAADLLSGKVRTVEDVEARI